MPPVPAKPTQAEQDEHYATGHAAYRSWCEHCVKGRGRASPHAVVFEGELPEVGADYAYLGPEGSQVTILVCKCKRTECLAATQVPEKGMNVYALAFFTGWLRGLGWKRLLLRSDHERALLAFLRAAAVSLEGVEVTEQASPEGDHAANGLAEVGVREVKAQTRVLKSHLEERLKRQLDWSEPLATWLVRHSANCLSRYRIQNDGKTRRTGKRWRRQVVEFGEKAAFLPVAARREGRVAGDAERMMDGILVGHHERTGAPLFLSERGLPRGTRVQRKTADQQWDNELIRKCRGVPWMLTGEELEVRPPPMPAVMMPILKQYVARYGPTCEACTTLAAGAQTVTKPHSDECRARMEELMQRDEDTLVQQRLHTDRLRRGSTVVEASEDERRNPDVEMAGSGLPSEAAEKHLVAKAHENPREQKQRLRGVQPGSGEPMQTAPEDAETRRGLKRSAELPIDDPRSEVRGRGLHLDDDVPIVTPTVPQTERPADAAEAHMSMGKMELISNASAKMMNAAVKCELTSAEVCVNVRKQIHKLWHQFNSHH